MVNLAIVRFGVSVIVYEDCIIDQDFFLTVAAVGGGDSDDDSDNSSAAAAATAALVLQFVRLSGCTQSHTIEMKTFAGISMRALH